MKRAVILFAEGYETVEALLVVDLLRRGGVEVTMASITEDEFVRSSHGVNVEMDAVLGEIMLLLFGTIACAGIANLVNNCIDLSRTRNIIIVSLTLTIGIGGAVLAWGEFSLSGIGLAALVGVGLNLVLPREER